MILTMVAMLSMTTAFAEASELMFAAEYGKNDRKAMVARAIDNDVKWMRYVLNEDQMHTYLKLLNTTINNRGLNK